MDTPNAGGQSQRKANPRLMMLTWLPEAFFLQAVRQWSALARLDYLSGYR
jgi:hypothetical protein